MLWAARTRRWWLFPLALGLLAPPPVAIAAETAGTVASQQALLSEIGKHVSRDLRGFYASRGNRPVWFDAAGRPSPATAMLLDLLDSASLDGLQPGKLKPGALAKALAKASQSDKDLARAELAFSMGYVRYVQALRKAPDAGMTYESAALAPVVPTPGAAMAALTASPALDEQIRAMRWMNPFYAPLRAALKAGRFDPQQARIAAINLARLRALPAVPAGRWVMIDASSARLWMFEGTRQVGSMKVVVGKPATQTPAMAGFLRYAIVNPYWNLPDDLMPSRITQKVLVNGPGYVAANRYQLLGSWDDGAAVLDPRSLDWHAVASGARTIRARQLPGPGNFMGAVKFMFPNQQGIYLHDTPERELLGKEARQFSNGCIRLEDAARFGRWLLGRKLPRTREPEKRIELPELVPVYITYLTALPEGGKVTFRPDVYGRDAALLARD